MRSRRLFAYGAIYFFWGASFLAIREIVAVAPPFFAAGFRFTLAGAILYIWTRVHGAGNPRWREWRSSALLGILMFTINYACLFWAEQRVASGYAAIISATIPVWIFMGEWLLLAAIHPRPASIAGICLGIAGVALLVLPGSKAGGIEPAALALLLGALCWAIGALWSRKLPIPESPLVSAGLQMGLGGIMLLAFSAFEGEFARLPSALAAWNWRLTLDMAYLVLCASIAAFTAFLYLMNREPASQVASCSYVNPLIAVIIGAVLAGERLTPVQMVGAVFVISGVFFTLRGKSAASRIESRPELRRAASSETGD